MSAKIKKVFLIDNGGRRWGGVRRYYSYSLHIPERRSDNERRSGGDRRKTSRIKFYRKSANVGGKIQKEIN